MTDDFSPLKAILDDFEKLIRGPGSGEQPEDVYAYYNLMLRAQKAFRDISGRWDNLGSWGVLTKIPQAKVDDWIRFQRFWSEKTAGGAFAGLDDMAQLRAQSAALVDAENQASKLGFESGKLDRPDVPTEIQQNQAVIDTTTGTDREFAKLHNYNTQKLDEAKKLAADAAKRLEDLPSSLWGTIPWYVKLGGAAIGLAIVANAVRR